MTRREIVLKKLTELSYEEVQGAIKQLTLHVKARLRFNSLVDRTQSGAHSEQNLGMPAVEYYVGESIEKLYDPDGGWDWKFEKLTFVEQLTRIANSLISRKVAQYEKAKEKQKLPIFVQKDISEIHDLDGKLSLDYNRDEMRDKLIDLAYKVSEDNDDLFSFSVLYFENKDFPSIAKEMIISIEKVYGLRKKLVRRLMKHKHYLEDEREVDL